jgi:hypothetical protein
VNLKTIRTALLFYAFSVILSESTLGNPNFPITLWAFQKISVFYWSVPVHGIGFLWLLFWVKILRDKPILFSILVSSLFFLVMEMANWFVFQFFTYEPYLFGAEGSFATILLLYVILCSITCMILRSDTNLQ